MFFTCLNSIPPAPNYAIMNLHVKHRMDLQVETGDVGYTDAHATYLLKLADSRAIYRAWYFSSKLLLDQVTCSPKNTRICAACRDSRLRKYSLDVEAFPEMAFGLPCTRGL